ncbi:hypothetical protein K7472_16060 [Streptomyces sp. PTM05]|uniref:Uncharacterized protein n=1 Tax=Streptantibioticus parmotrematis TaxID=2873249 RepID=A0ABS7QT53_9ACTN|nr:hypothetical protein [Streptantibioticus parmotrematis]MBY8886370.1 hypothetical protein [Streptantibioticus parmotrematis]
MRTRVVDPRDVEWEQDEPRYRVYFWDRERVTSHEFAVTDAGVDEALAWARQRAGAEGWAYTFYVEVAPPHGPGLVRLEGVAGDPFA